eukprot:CAMPEP_0117568870 /NCGR_PEP_ID=MMETSP0784-20121206/58364_1 /TAXON_ID=39447 /ORGANISM="" /LENGTH=278 /DNA_ID=CAMNT_0005366823 /DNA_START=14 /DNA_END=850 /DNA_ORIENTATION=-
MPSHLFASPAASHDADSEDADHERVLTLARQLTMTAERIFLASTEKGRQECISAFLDKHAAAVRVKRMELQAAGAPDDMSVAGHFALQLMLTQLGRLAAGEARQSMVAGLSVARSGKVRRKRGCKRVRNRKALMRQALAASEAAAAALAEAADTSAGTYSAALRSAVAHPLLMTPRGGSSPGCCEVGGVASFADEPDLAQKGCAPLGAWFVVPPDGTAWEWPLTRREKTVRLVVIQQNEIQVLSGGDEEDWLDDDADGYDYCVEGTEPCSEGHTNEAA